METAQDIIKAVGRKELARKLDKSMSAVGKAYQANILPALWFDALEKLTGRTLPRSAFSFNEVKE